MHLVIVLLFLLTPPSSPEQADVSAEAVSITTSLLYPSTSGGLRRLYVTLRNRSTVPLKSVRVQTEDGLGALSLQDAGDLQVRQSQVLSFEIPPGRAKGLVLGVDYSEAGVPNRTVINVPFPQAAVSNQGLISAILPAIFGLIGAVGGSFVTAYVTGKREMTRIAYEWSRARFQLYESQYRLFMRRVSGTVDPNQIRVYFEQLDEAALVTPALRSELQRALASLDKQPNRDQKISTRDEFLNRFDALLLNPVVK